MVHDPMRRRDSQRLNPVEKMLLDAMVEVENVGADPRLTDAVVLLGKARESLADYYDDVPRKNYEAVTISVGPNNELLKVEAQDASGKAVELNRRVIDPKTILKD